MTDVRAQAKELVSVYLQIAEGDVARGPDVGITGPNLDYVAPIPELRVEIWQHVLDCLKCEEAKPDPDTFHPDYPLGEPLVARREKIEAADMTCIGCGYDFLSTDEMQSRYHEVTCTGVDPEWRKEAARRMRRYTSPQDD